MVAEQGLAVELEWGPAGAAALADRASYAVVVDVLSFSTTVSVALDEGIEVHPYRWGDDRAARYAGEHRAALAVGRHQARRTGRVGAVTLSPVSVRAARGLERLVLPSPNGSAICFALAEAGTPVLTACLRNRSAVVAWLVSRLVAPGPEERRGHVAVVAAGEHRTDGSLRPAVEDLLGAGAVLAGLRDGGCGVLSPEAEAAAAAYDAIADRLPEVLHGCASGRELAGAGFGGDVDVAAELDSSASVPLLTDGRFRDEGPRSAAAGPAPG